MTDAYVIDVVRTPIGKFAGALSSVRPDDMLASVIVALLGRNESVDLAAIEDIIAGAANQAGEDNRNVARMAGLLAGLPVSVAGTTVNRLCASGLQAIMDATRQIRCGDAELVLACGVESMTRAPFVTAKPTQPFQRTQDTYDTTLGWRFINPRLASEFPPYSMGETAENVARQWNISREEQDQFALHSQEKYAAAKNADRWQNEIVPVELVKDGLVSWLLEDEHPRQTSLEKPAKLKPAARKPVRL